ncbi:uncharacterized protein UHO2_01238 [Ustilago hordei]|uniref:uncharacterized protein n=1 Tax=Ustilago hordei TaxID=120017 RepID=UPI001A4D731F|nr:uncharacterized protein UHO2_01238 [Ustilago hordei]SYW74373.1 related to Mig1 protein, induced during biotrophic phase [Ustilago hordei]
MAPSPYCTQSKTAASAPPSEVAAAPPRCHQIMVWLQPPHVANPLASPVALSPLEPLFLGMDDDIIVPSPLPSPLPAHLEPNPMGEDYSPASPPVDLYKVDVTCPPLDLTTPECQAAWEAELARSPTPPPTADEVIDAVLTASRAGTPVFRPEVQPLTPPPCWVGCQMPPPPPLDWHLPSNQEIAGWAEGFIMANLLTRVVDGYYPHNWDVPASSLPARHLQHLVMLCLMEGCMLWPSWQCHHCFNLGVLCFASAFTNPFGEQTQIPRVRVTGSYGRSTGIGDLVDTSGEHGHSAVSMETMDFYGLTCKGGLGPYVRRARHSHKEDQAQRSIQMVTTQGLERQEPKEPSPVKGEGAVYRELASRS